MLTRSINQPASLVGPMQGLLSHLDDDIDQPAAAEDEWKPWL